MIRFFLARFRERSTWVGLITLLVTLGAPLMPDLQAALADLGPALVGLLLVLLPDGPPHARDSHGPVLGPEPDPSTSLRVRGSAETVRPEPVEGRTPRDPWEHLRRLGD